MSGFDMCDLYLLKNAWAANVNWQIKPRAS
jgi:hypothetical protein